MLQDLTAAAIADALAKVEEAQRDAMRSSLLGAFGASP
jgi:DNA-binding protein YbaB